MRLITFDDGGLKLGVVGANGGVIGFESLGLEFRDMSEFVEFHSKKELEILENASLKNSEISFDKILLKAPIITPKQDIICLGINYLDHAKESYKFKGKEFDGKREYPVYFSKRVNFAVGSGESVLSHADITNSLDYEAELAVIISKDAKDVSKDRVNEYIFGYTILNDFSARDLQNRHKQFYFGKSLDGLTAMGPWIETKLNASDLAIKSYVNGELRQNARTKDMIFDISYVVEELSKGMTLKAGTIISMGTPSGVGMGFEPPKFLKSGDEVVCEIENLGKLANRVV